jgi:hypothetical protein
MLLYCKHLKHKVYDDIRSNINNIYGIDMSHTDDVIMNAIPIKYNNNYWIVSPLADLEIGSLELTRQSWEIKYIINEEIKGNISINKVCSLHELESGKDYKMIDCFYDEHLDIMFIKFQDIRIEYFDISDCIFEWFDNGNNSIKFIWLNNILKKKIITSIHNNIIFEDKFINLPSIPYIMSDTTLINELIDCPMLDYPCTGSAILNEDGQLIGIVNYINKNNIISIPITLIKKSLDYLKFSPIITWNVNFIPIQMNFKNNSNDDIIQYGLYLKKNNKKRKNNIIISIDNYPICSNGYLLIKKHTIPISTYLWLLKKVDIIKIKAIGSKMLNNICINKENNDIYYVDFSHIKNIKFSYYSSKLFLNINNALLVSKLNYINYNKKYLIEINEKIMQILKILFQSTDNYDILYDYINENKYSNNRIVIMIDTRINIKIIKKIKHIVINNIDTIINFFPEKNMLKQYIKTL